jgi:hypothetical protein
MPGHWLEVSWQCGVLIGTVSENIVNKRHHKYCSAFVGYLYILDLINAQKMGHIKLLSQNLPGGTWETIKPQPISRLFWLFIIISFSINIYFPTVPHVFPPPPLLSFFFILPLLAISTHYTIASYKLMCWQLHQWSRWSSIDVASVCHPTLILELPTPSYCFWMF